MKFSLATQALVALCSIAGGAAAESAGLRGSRELQVLGAEVLCAYVVSPDGTRRPVVSPCVDPSATTGAMAATVGTGGRSSDSGSRD